MGFKFQPSTSGPGFVHSLSPTWSRRALLMYVVIISLTVLGPDCVSDCTSRLSAVSLWFEELITQYCQPWLVGYLVSSLTIRKVIWNYIIFHCCELTLVQFVEIHLVKKEIGNFYNVKLPFKWLCFGKAPNIFLSYSLKMMKHLKLKTIYMTM